MKIDFAPDPALYPFESRWFETSAGLMHYVDEGPREAPPIVLFHGNPAWSFLYRHIIVGLRDRFRVVAMDYLGFGLSEHPDQGFDFTIAEHIVTAGELVDHVGLDGYISMGQDGGGPISMGVAVERADRVAGVVLGNTFFWPAELDLRSYSRVMGTRPVQWLIRERNMFIRRFMPLLMTTKLSAEETSHYVEVHPSPASLRGVAEAPKQANAARPLLERLEQQVPSLLGAKPTLIVWGMKDPAFRAGPNLPRMQRAFNDHQVLRLPKANHFIQEDAPDEIVEAIIRRFS